MNPFIMPVRCSICGEEGMATPDGATGAWFGATLYHADPSVCAENIRRQKEREARKRKATAPPDENDGSGI